MEECDNIRRLMALGESGVELRAHLAVCPACRSRFLGYQRAIHLGLAATDRLSPPMADVTPRFLEPRPKRRPSRPLAAAAGLALAAAIAVFVARQHLPEDRGAPNPVVQQAVVPPDGAGPGAVEPGPEGLLQTNETGTVLERNGLAKVAVGPRCRVRVEAWSDSRTLLWLDHGRLDVTVSHREPGQTFEIRTEYGRAYVVGTRFIVEHQPGRHTEVTGLEGIVRLEDREGNEVARVVAGRVVRLIPSSTGVGVEVMQEPAAADRDLAAPSTREPQKPPAAPPPIVAPAPATPPMDVEALAREVQRLLSAGRKADAIRHLTAALADPSAPRAHLLALLGDAHRAAGSLEEARAAWEEALRVGPPVEGVLVDLASLLGGPLERPGEAVAQWRHYLEAFPRGHYAGRARWELAKLARSGGLDAESTAFLQDLVADLPGSPEAVPALVEAGRRTLAAGNAEEAAGFFLRFVDHPRTDLAEAALVGLMRVRFQQGSAAEVRRLGDEHRRRYPQGVRRAEVQRLLEAISEAPGTPAVR
jgi:tetratricopeptide (TPR) repeat protein